MLRALCCVLLIGLSCGHLSARALEVSILHDPESTLEASAITAGQLDDRFLPLADAVIEAHPGTTWIRIADWTAAAPALIVGNSRDARVALLWRDHTDAPPRNLIDTTWPRDEVRHALVFDLSATPSDASAVYLKTTVTAGARTQRMTLAVSSMADARAAGLRHSRIVTMTFGALVAVGLASLCVWVIARERPYLYYAGTVIFEGFWVALSSSEGLSWPVLDTLGTRGPTVGGLCGCLSTALLCLFVREVTPLNARWRFLHHCFAALAGIFLLVAIALPWVSAQGYVVLAITNNALVGLTGLLIVTITTIDWRLGHRASGWFLLAWSVVLGFLLTAVAVRLAGIPPPPAVLYGLPFAVTLTAIGLSIGLAQRVREQQHALAEARRHASTDSLTGVLNRRSILDVLQASLQHAQQSGGTVSLLFIDLDHFKMINDRYGHLGGDAVLKSIVEPFAAELRQADALGRYGGEEFVVVLQGAGIEVARTVANRIRERVAETICHYNEHQIRLTCSIGIASTADISPATVKALVGAADEAVYLAKQRGRNRVHARHDPVPSEPTA